MAGNAALHRRRGHIFIGKDVAGTAQARADDPDHVGGLHAAAGETPCECREVVGCKGGFEFGERAQRQAQDAPFTVDQRLDLAAMTVRPSVTQTLRHHSTPNVRRPADSSAISNCTSPSWRPEYSSATIWNGPAMVPKSGMTICQPGMVPAKNAPRTSASLAASLKMPDAVSAALCTPAPASNSRQRPALSPSVMSTAWALKASR
ncbi:hypothetical protein Atu0961 [Agrobacterium fabrum str. C58]|uniref:Uncharacterized protein n=1 Tax=Agrobacterium fabrum (strain C58 / ATCC 33970) TaxID=176299 RepID=Q8UGS4_AGRFC|nr:hypothetical protein Atu0961 [Agrobacterium fabrum str. C58]